jgi:hypothetical protein
MIKKDEKFPERPVIMVIYGVPGSGKTSVANTCENAVLIDCDRGADRAVNRVDTIIAKTWHDILKDENLIKNYKTVIIDTAKAALDDYLMAYVVEKDYKLKTNKLKAYGAIGEEFKAFINARRAENVDIVIIAHAKQEQDGDIFKYYPDVTGQSKDLILRIADQVGFITIENKRRVINFDPTDKTIGKNVAKIPTTIIPDDTTPEFQSFGKMLIEKVKNSLQKQSEEQVSAQLLMATLSDTLGICLNADDLNHLFAKCKELPKSNQLAMWKLIQAKATEMNCSFDNENKKFFDNE